jgi:rare lipoprotein A
MIYKTMLLFLWMMAACDAGAHFSIPVRDSVSPIKKNVKVLYGTASFYSDYFDGRKTASGEIFSQKKFTCACNVLPLGTWIRVTNVHNNRSVVVRTNDRLHPRMKRIVDLTRVAATQLGFIKSGLTRVKVEVLGKKYKNP